MENFAKRKKWLVLICLSFVLTGCWGSASVKNIVWRKISDGLNYAFVDVKVTSSADPKNLVLAQIDPHKYKFFIYQNQDLKSAKSIQDIEQSEGALLALNGSFFTTDFKPTGLLISSGEKVRKLSGADLLDGTFTIDKNGNPALIQQGFDLRENDFEFAIQNGPVLVDGFGNILAKKDSGKSASRTAIGIDKSGNVILILDQQSILNSDNDMTLYEFAHAIKESPEIKSLNLRSVLNLDGGPSSGMSFGENYFPEMSKVQNVILVKSRGSSR